MYTNNDVGDGQIYRSENLVQPVGMVYFLGGFPLSYTLLSCLPLRQSSQKHKLNLGSGSKNSSAVTMTLPTMINRRYTLSLPITR